MTYREEKLKEVTAEIISLFNIGKSILDNKEIQGLDLSSIVSILQNGETITETTFLEVADMDFKSPLLNGYLEEVLKAMRNFIDERGETEEKMCPVYQVKTPHTEDGYCMACIMKHYYEGDE